MNLPWLARAKGIVQPHGFSEPVRSVLKPTYLALIRRWIDSESG
jgi:hypothetical protein